jgi:hypothetical protein
MTNLPAEISTALANPAFTGNLGALMEAALGGGARFLSYKNSRFHIKDGGVDVVYKEADGKADAMFMDLIVLNSGRTHHCVWYDRPYDDKTASTDKPAAVWWSDAPAPPHVPEWVTKSKDPKGYLHFQYRLRLVVLPVRVDSKLNIEFNLDNFCVTDLASQSLFGKADHNNSLPFMTLAGMIGRSGCNFPDLIIRAYFDTTKSTPALRFTIPLVDPATGGLRLLQQNLREILYKKAVSPEVVRWLDPVGPEQIQAPPQVQQYQPQSQPQVQQYQPQPQTTEAPPMTSVQELAKSAEATIQKAKSRRGSKKTAALEPAPAEAPGVMTDASVEVIDAVTLVTDMNPPAQPVQYQPASVSAPAQYQPASVSAPAQYQAQPVSAPPTPEVNRDLPVDALQAMVRASINNTPQYSAE